MPRIRFFLSHCFRLAARRDLLPCAAFAISRFYISLLLLYTCLCCSHCSHETTGARGCVFRRSTCTLCWLLTRQAHGFKLLALNAVLYLLPPSPSSHFLFLCFCLSACLFLSLSVCLSSVFSTCFECRPSSHCVRQEWPSALICCTLTQRSFQQICSRYENVINSVNFP